MKTLSKAYALFGETVCADSFRPLPGLCFRKLCKSIGVSPVDLSGLIREELGMSGPELLQALFPGS